MIRNEKLVMAMTSQKTVAMNSKKWLLGVSSSTSLMNKVVNPIRKVMSGWKNEFNGEFTQGCQNKVCAYSVADPNEYAC